MVQEYNETGYADIVIVNVVEKETRISRSAGEIFLRRHT
jgi:hypothetical protein